MPPMVWTIELINTDCSPSAVIVVPADCSCRVMPCMVCSTCCTTAAPSDAPPTVLRDTSSAICAACLMASSRWTCAVTTEANLTTRTNFPCASFTGL
ncbi:hypothetical protein D3C73_1405250 [compost metagenome]